MLTGLCRFDHATFPRIGPACHSTALALSDIKPNAGGRYRDPQVFPRGSGLEGGEEVSDLVIDLGRLGQSRGDLQAEQFAVAAA